MGKSYGELVRRAGGSWDGGVIAIREHQMGTLHHELLAQSALLDMLRRIEPYIDGIVCYASTCGEHEPNRIARDLRLLLKCYGPETKEQKEDRLAHAAAEESGALAYRLEFGDKA